MLGFAPVASAPIAALLVTEIPGPFVTYFPLCLNVETRAFMALNVGSEAFMTLDAGDRAFFKIKAKVKHC